jgi:hypothetical protein
MVAVTGVAPYGVALATFSIEPENNELKIISLGKNI